MSVLFENIPQPCSLLVPKYQMCQTLSLEVIAFSIFCNYWPYLTLGNLCGQKKTQVHICGPWAISVPPYDSCTMYRLWGDAFTSCVTHTQTHIHTYTHTQTGPHRFLMLIASEPKILYNILGLKFIFVNYFKFCRGKTCFLPLTVTLNAPIESIQIVPYKTTKGYG